MSYIDENLINGEVVLYRTKLHWIVLFWPVFVGSLFALGAIAMLIGSVAARGDQTGASGGLVGFALVLLLVAAALILMGVLRRSSTEMAVTNKRVMVKVGLLSRRTIEIVLQKVESIVVDQSLMGRVLNYGSITVRGTGGTPEPFANISHPLEFRRQVQEQLDKLHSSAANA